MSVTLSEVKRAARAHRAPLAGESAGYLVLALADQVLSAPRLIEAGDVQLTDDGGLRVLRGQASSETEAELSLRRALDGLLLVASSGSAALMRAGRRVSPVGLPGLVRELEAALIPVNRAAARRALARLQRETARALESGTLAPEPPEPLEAFAPVAAPTSPPAVVLGPTTAVSPRVPVHGPAAEVSEPAADMDESETVAIVVAAPNAVDLPAVASSLEEVPSASREVPEPRAEQSVSSDAPTVAPEVALVSARDEMVLLDEDVEFIDDDPSDALTVVRHMEVQVIAGSGLGASESVQLPDEACTRPEPVILRRGLGPVAPIDVAPPAQEMAACTPTLGSLAAELPVLAPERIAELTRNELQAQAASTPPQLQPEPTASSEPSPPLPQVEDSVVCSAASEEPTEPMPEVAPLSPGVAIVPGRPSDLSALLANFQVAEDGSHQDLRRAIKDLAELDLTPAPFAALIR